MDGQETLTDQLPDMPKAKKAPSNELPDMPVKKKDGTTPSPFPTNDYRPTAEDIHQKRAMADLESSFTKLGGGSEPQSPSSDPFLNIPQSGDLTPILPEHREAYKKDQLAKQQAVTDHFKQLRSELPKEAQKGFDKALEMGSNSHPDQLGVPSKENIDHYNYMQTPAGKLIGAAKYIGSEATHGTIQIAKGLAHVANMANNPAGSMMGIEPTDEAFKEADKFADYGLTDNDKATIENMSVPTVNGHRVGVGAGVAAVGQMANFAPSIAAGEAAGLPKTLLYLQGLGQAKEMADKMPDLNPLAKEALIQGGGVVNMALADFGGKIFGKGVSSAVKDKVVQGIATDALKEAAEKGLSEDGYKNLLTGKTQSFVEKLDRSPSEILKHYTDAAKTFTKLNVGNYAVHKAVDALQTSQGDKPVFNENLGNLAENESNSLTKQVPLFGSIGALDAASKLLPNSGYENEITKAVINNPSQANIDNIKYNIEQHGHENGWNSDEIKATHDHIDKISQAVKSLPATVKNKTKAVGLILDRNELQTELDKSAGERKNLDPVYAEMPSAKEQYLTDKIEQANDKLMGLVKDQKPTYSKGLAINNEEGKFFKTIGGKMEEITPSRYDLETTEREAKKPIHEQTKPNTEIPAEQPADETVGVPKVADQNDEKGAQQPKNDGTGNDGENRPGEKAERPKSSTGKTTFKKPPVKISEQAKTLADKIRSLKSDKNSLHGGLQGVGVAIYDGALETAATVIENGGKLIDAIDAAVKHILANSEEKDRDKIRSAITKDLKDAGITDEDKPEKTGIRHADTEKEREEAGTKSDVAKKDRRRETIDAKGKELVDDDPDYANRTANDIIDKERPATDVEQAALEYRKTQLKNQRRKILKDTDPENASDNEIKIAKITDEIALNQKATDIGGSELGSGLGYRTQLMNEDYSTETIIGRAKVANGGEELDPSDKAELEKRTKRIEELENQRDDLVEKLKKQSENSLVDKVNRTANHEERQAKREVTKASLRKEREGLLADLHLLAKKARSNAGANKIPVDMIVPLTKLARNYVLDGATSLASVVDKLYNDLKDHIDGLDKEDIASIVKENFDKYLTEQNELRLGRAKKLQATKLEKLKSGTFEQKTYAKILVDNDYLNIRAEINREQQKVNKKIADIENSKKSWNRKAVDIAVKYGRQAKLASVTVLGKLASTGLATMGIKPIQEGLGKGYSAILPKVSAKSSIEGSVSRSAMREANRLTDGAAVKSISEAYSRAFTIGMKDAYQELTGAGSNLTNLYKERGATLPSEAKEFFGHIHSAIKAPVKRFAWELSYAKRTAKMIDAGLDPLDPVNDAQNRLNAYKDAEKAIFMGDNTLSKIYENNVGSLEKSQSSISRTAGAAFRILLPFVKVPSNIVLEGAKYSFGSVSGLARLGRAMSKGMDNLSPEEADIILEHLKKGSIGGAALALGFFNPKMFGGFYQPGKKEKVAPGRIKVDGVNIPAFLVEHPVFIAAQVGANFRQLLDKYRHVDGRIPAAAWGTISGLGYEVPQANEIKRLVDLTTGGSGVMKKLTKFGAETVKGEIEPAALQQLAEITDVKEGAKTTIPGLAFSDHTQQKRAPKLKRHGFMKYVGQMLESGVPGLRKNVPKKH